MAKRKTDALKRVKINGTKLHNLLVQYKQETGVSMSELGRELGFNECYFSQNIKIGMLSKVAIYYLESKGIRYDDYAPDPEPEVVEPVLDLNTLEEPETPVQTVEQPLMLKDMTADEFSKIIYTAIYEAMSKAWENM